MKILVVGPSWVGDMVMAQTLFIHLKSIDREVEIDVLAPDWTEPLLVRMPEVNKAINMPIGHGSLQLSARWKVAKKLQKTGYDQAILLPNSFKSALIPFFAKIPLRTGWRGEARSWILNDSRILNKEEYPLMQQRFAALAYTKGFRLPSPLLNPALTAKSNALTELEKKHSLKLNKDVLVLCPGAEFGLSKKWPEQYYASVAEESIKLGMQVWILGSKNDQVTADNIVSALSEDAREYCKDFTGKTSLGDAIDLISNATMMVSNDSGLMHVGAALSIPLVVIYGSTSPKFTPPLAEKVKMLALSLPCSPCFKRECPLQHLQCLRDLHPEKVLKALNELRR